MSAEAQDIYPGGEATSEQVISLAAEYHRVAVAVRADNGGRNHLSRFPYRLLAIHAIELYLNALLLERGLGAGNVRGLKHDLKSRTDQLHGLALRKRTVRHLEQLSNAREYLVARYAPEVAVRLSELNRLEATLSEVAAKVTALVNSKRD